MSSTVFLALKWTISRAAGTYSERLAAIAEAIGVEVKSVYTGRRLGGFNVITGAAPATTEGGAA